MLESAAACEVSLMRFYARHASGTGELRIDVLPDVPSQELVPEALPLNVVYQDGQVVVVDKPAGLTVHPGPGHSQGTLVNALLSRYPELKAVGDPLRPGLVHRLDADTSGLIVVAKTPPATKSDGDHPSHHSLRHTWRAPR